MSTFVPLAVLLGLIALISLPVVLIIVIARGRKSPADGRRPRGAAASPARPDPRSPYERIPTLLTAAERDFFAALQQAAPAGHQVFAQVRLANLVQVKQSARREKSHWWRIQAMCLDFVLVDVATFVSRLVVELDDASHNRADRRDRDAFVDEVLAATGIPILHVRWQRSYDTRALAQQIAARLGIAAPVPATALHGDASVPAPPLPTVSTAVPAVASSVIPAPIAASRRACGQCQTELREGAKFCAQCGAVFTV
jgi:very-short-patch-repair endonuclease